MPGQQQTDAFVRIFGTSSSGTSVSSAHVPAHIAHGDAGKARGPAAALFEVPCHVLPPMRTLVAQFMDVVLQSAAAGKAAEEGSGSNSDGNDAKMRNDESEDDGNGSDSDDDSSDNGDEVDDVPAAKGRSVVHAVAAAASAAVKGTARAHASLDEISSSASISTDPAQLDFMVHFFKEHSSA